MAQNTFALMTNLGRAKEAAAIANGTAVVITHIAIGDGTTVPSGGETALYHEVARKAISGHGTVVGASNVAYFDIFLEASEGPYTIREAGLIDQDGDLIAIARYDPPINKPVPASGQTVEGTVRLEVAFSNIANVTIVVDPSFMVPLQRLSRLPWIPVISMAATTPPVSPSLGDSYLVATGATGAWVGQSGKIAEYTAAGWGIISPANGHGISLPDGRVFERVNGVYVEKIALDSQSGKWNYATASGTANSVVSNLDPAPQSLGFGFWLRLKITATNTMAVTLNVNALGAKPVLRIDGAALIEGDLSNGDIAELVYDGNAWRLVSYCRSLLPRPLGSNQTFFVRPDGDDTNNGLANTAGSAFKTLEGAWAAVSTRYAPSDKYAIIFQLAPGTYEGAMFSGYSGSVIVIGNASDRGSYKIVEPAGKNFCVSANQGKVEYRGVTIRSQSIAGTQVLMIWAASTVSVTLTDCRVEVPVSNPNLSVVYASSGAIVEVRGSIEISGGNGRSDISAVISTESGALFSGGLYAAPVTWTIYNLGCQQAWVNADSLSFQSWLAVTFSKIGSQFAGRRFNATKNAVITTGGGGENFFPGDQGGSIDAGGVYL